MSAALLVLLLLPVARFVLEAVVVCVALATKDSSRRDAAVTILPVIRSTRRGAAAALTKDEAAPATPSE